MPRQYLRFGFKIALKDPKGFVMATNNLMAPLGIPQSASMGRFENAVFQVVSGDGDVTTDITQKRIGEEIKFGQIIRLLHVNSNTFVCESQHRSAKEKANQKVVLADFQNPEVRASRWRVVPRYKVRSEGQKIIDRDVVVLQSVTGDNSFLHVAAMCDSSTDHHYEVNSSMTAAGFVVHTYDTEASRVEAREMRCGDCIQLYHREERAFFIRDKGGAPDAAQVVLETAAADDGGVNSNSMFVVEFDDVLAGGSVTYGRKRMYQLKSLSTGYYLCARLKLHGFAAGLGTGAKLLDKAATAAKSAFGAASEAIAGAMDRSGSPEASEPDDIDFDDSIEVTLVPPEKKDVGTRVCFHQAADDSSNVVRSHSRVFLEFPFVKEGLWLGSGNSMKMAAVRRGSSGAAAAVEEISRTRKEAVVRENVSHKDGIELIKVGVSDFQQLVALLALLPPIKRMTDILQRRVMPTSQLWAQVKENLQLIGRMCSNSGEDDITRREGTPLLEAQNRLVDQNVPALCIDLVEAVFTEGSVFNIETIDNLSIIPESEKQEVQSVPLKFVDFQLIVRFCFHIVRLTCRQHQRAAMIMAAHLERFVPYVDYNVGALDALAEIYRDNLVLCDTPDDLSLVHRFVEKVRKNCRNNGGFSQFLALLCSCRDIGLRDPQAVVGKALLAPSVGKVEGTDKLMHKIWLAPGEKDSPPLVRIDAESTVPTRNKALKSAAPAFHESDDDNASLEGTKDKRVSQAPLEDFCSDAGDGRSGTASSRASFSLGSTQLGGGGMMFATTPSYIYLSQLKLFTALCSGRNEANIDMVRQLCPPDALLSAMQNENLPGELRGELIKVFCATQINVAPYSDQVDVARNLVRVWDQISQGKSEFDPMTHHPISKEILDMKAFLLAFMRKHCSLDPTDKATNRAIEEATYVAREYARLGLIPHAEMEEWIKALTPVLDGRDDATPVVSESYIRRFGKYSRYNYDEDNHILMVIKSTVLQVFEIFATYARAIIVSRLVIDFKEHGLDEEKLPHLCTILDYRVDGYCDKKSRDYVDDKESRRKRLEGNFLQQGLGAITDTVGAGLDVVGAVGGGLMDLAGVGKKEHKLAYLQELIEVCLDIAQYQYRPLVVKDLSLLVSLLNQHIGILEQLRSVQILSSADSVAFYEAVKPRVNTLAMYGDRNVPKHEVDTIVDICTYLGKILDEGDDDKNAILKNIGAHKCAANICKVVGLVDAQKLPRWTEQLLVALYGLLARMARLSQATAWDLFPLFDVFCKHLALKVGVIPLLRGMLEGNIDLCSSLSDTAIQDIVFALPQTGFDPEIAFILRTLMWNEATGDIIRRNQQPVLKALLDAEDSVQGVIRCRDLTTGTTGKRIRDKLLGEEEYLQPGSKVVYHLEIMNVVALCMQGRDKLQLRNEVRSALFSSTTSIDDIFEVLCNRSVPFFYRAVYLRLFTALYADDRTFRQNICEHKGFRKMLTVMQEDLLTFDTKMSDELDSPGGEGGGVTATESPTAKPSSPMLNSESFLFFIFNALLPCLKSVLVNVVQETFGDDDETRHIDHLMDISEKMGAVSELCNVALTKLVANSLYKPPPEDPVEPEEEKKSSFNPFGAIGNLFSSKEEKVAEKKERWICPLPPRLRVPMDFVFRASEDTSPPLRLPHIPVSGYKVLATVVDEMANCRFREKLEDDTLPRDIATVMDYVDKASDAEEGKLSRGVELFNMWQEYCDLFERKSEGTNPETSFDSAAILLMRKSMSGHNAVRAVVRVIDRHEVDISLKIPMLQLLRKVLSVQDEEFSDASILWEEADELDVEESLRYETEQTMLTLDKTQEERQNLFAGFDKGERLSPKLAELLSLPDKDLQMANIACLNAMLEGGNNKVQSNLLTWAKDRSDEEFFVNIRQYMIKCRDSLRDRKRAIKREIPDPAKRAEKLPKELHERLRRRFNFDLPLKMLQLVQLLCEGHYLEMQDYFRVQADNQISINVLESITGVLENLVKSVDASTFELMLQCLATITEMLQGPCFGNQEFMVSQNIGDAVTVILKTTYADLSEEENWQLRMAAMTLVISLMEGHMNAGLIQTLLASLDMAPMVQVMDDTYEKWADEHGELNEGNLLTKSLDMGKDIMKGLLVGLGEEDEFQDELNLSTYIFIFMKTVLDVDQLLLMQREASGQQHEHLQDKEQNTIKELFRMSKFYKRLSKKVSTIEIMRNGRLEKVYFRIPRMCVENLKEESKDRVINLVNRSGDGARLASFFSYCINLTREMEFYEEMRRTRGLSLVHKYDPYINNLSLCTAFTINIYLLVTVDYRNAEETRSHVTPGEVERGFKALGILQIVIQCLLFTNFFFGPTRIYLAERWMEYQQNLDNEAVQQSKATLSIEAPKLEKDAPAKLPFFVRWFITIVYLFMFPPLYIRAAFVVVAFVGFYYIPIWYSFQMLQIIGKSVLLRNVVDAVLLNKLSLALTGALLLVVTYIFAIIAYFFFSDMYAEDGGLGPGGNCDTLLRCTIVSLVYGLKMGGGISELTSPPMFGGSQDTKAYARLLYDFTFFLIMIIMFLNLVFGIILDTFSQLREQRDFIYDDQHDKCFICGLEQADFDKVSPGGFQHHVKFDHHMWDYLYFMHYVMLKPEEDHNGQEGFVLEAIDDREARFFPIGKSMVIEANDGNAVETEELADEKPEAEKAAAGEEKGGADDDGAGIAGAPSTSFGHASATADDGRLARIEAMLADLTRKK